MKKAIITISGGIDSTLTAAIAKKDGYELYFLTANYGQRNLKRELENTSFLANYYRAKKYKIIELTWLGQLGNSMITDTSIQVDPNNDHQIYVPFRNTCILAAAIAWAETDLDIKRIYIGSDGESEDVCPDNSPAYIKSINELIKVSTKNNRNLEVVAPLNHMTKTEIIKKAIEYKIPMEHTWTCVSNSEVACGLCDPCRARKEAFMKLGIKDTIKYNE